MRLCIFTSSRGVSLKKVSYDISRVLQGKNIDVRVFESPVIDVDVVEGCDAAIVVMTFDLTWGIPYMFILYEFTSRGKPSLFYATTEGRVPKEILPAWVVRDLLFVAASGYVRAKLSEVNARVVDVIPHGVDVEFIQSLKDLGREARESLGVSRDALLVGYVAQGHERKCHDLFSEVVSIVRSRDKSIEFLIVTDKKGAEYYGNVDAVVMDAFGRLSDDQYYAYLHAIDVYAHGSCSEGFGIPVLEALACGKYVVHPSYDPLNEITTPNTSLRVRPHEILLVRIGGSGIIFELKRYRPERFAEAILSAASTIRSEAKRREIEVEALERARKFNIYDVYTRFIGLLKKV